MNAIHSGEIKGLLSICFNPLVSLPDANFTREALSKLEFFGVIDFFLSETAQHADVVLAGSLQEEEEGVGCNAEGARDSHSEGGRSARQCARAIPRSSATWRTGWAAASISRSRIPREIFEELRVASRGGVADYYGITYEKIDRADGRLLAVPVARPSRHAAAVRGRQVLHPDGKARFNVTEWRDSGDPVDDEYPVLPDHRPRGQPVSVRHADPPHRRAGGSDIPSRGLRSIRGWPSSTESKTATG